MPRFFVDTSISAGQEFILAGENAAHAKVLRLRIGESVTLCDGRGMDYACTVQEISKDQIVLFVDESKPSGAEPRVHATVYMGFSKGDKLEHVIQKATELGAGEIVAFPCSRCVVKYDDKTLAKKLPRWQKIAASAAEQSGRGIIPVVRTVDSFQAALNRAAEADTAIFFYENERANTLTAALSTPFQSIALMTGPEGGFSEQEAQMALEAGLKVCTLGSRILRCETAPLCALSAVMYAAGEY